MALSLIFKRAVHGNYGSYSAMDSDPLLANVYSLPDFAAIRAAGLACQQQFLAAPQRLAVC
jgi:hypothetical protein